MIRSMLPIELSETRIHQPDSNQRRAGRIWCEGITCTWGTVINASASGMRLLARSRLLPPTGQVAVLRIDGLDGPFTVLAKVVWARHKNWGRREVGVQFVEVSPEARANLLRLAEVAGRDLIINGLANERPRRAG